MNVEAKADLEAQLEKARLTPDEENTLRVKFDLPIPKEKKEKVVSMEPELQRQICVKAILKLPDSFSR